MVIVLFGPALMGMFMDAYDEEIIRQGMQLLRTGMYLYMFLAMIYLYRAARSRVSATPESR